MKLTPYLSLFLLFLLFTAGCQDDLTLPDLEQAEAPSELSLDFRIAGDNSGAVTVVPGGRGVTSFSVDFGDGTSAPAGVAPGETLTHVYDEGVYTVTLEAMNINGKTTTYTEELTVSFQSPENLSVTVTPTPGNPLSIDVTATADGETNFLAYFGEEPDAEPISFQEGETVSHVYGSTGTYTVTVEARSGGSAFVADTITVNIDNPVLLPVTFEDTTKNYNFLPFGGASVAIVANPDPTGNGSAFVARLTKQQGAETYAGTVLELGAPIDLNSAPTLSVQVWSPEAGIPVLLKLENASDGDIFAEVTVNTTVANQWETLTFDFSGADLTQSYSKVVLFFDFGAAGKGLDYYFDNIVLGTGGGGGTDNDGDALPLDFEGASATYPSAGFGGATLDLIDNPDASGLNTSSRVARLNKSEGSEPWAGGVFELPAPIGLSDNPLLVAKVWSPAAGIPVLLKVENGDNGDIFIEVTATTTVANQWEELTFDYSGGDLTQTYSKVAIFFDFGTAGTGADYYFDDIRQAGSEPAGAYGLPVTFEAAGLEYAFTGFGGATADVIDNPDPSGLNPSARVGTLNKSAGSMVWAGAVTELDAPIDFSGSQRLAVKVWSPAAGIPVLLKVENATNGDLFIEVTANTTVANQWEELTFDYSGGDLTQSYSKVALFFDFGTEGTGADYYFDDIRQLP